MSVKTHKNGTNFPQSADWSIDVANIPHSRFISGGFGGIVDGYAGSFKTDGFSFVTDSFEFREAAIESVIARVRRLHEITGDFLAKMEQIKG